MKIRDRCSSGRRWQVQVRLWRRAFGVKEDHFPRFVVRDTKAEVLGEWQDGFGSGVRTQAARRVYFDLCWFGSVPVKILRMLAGQAGVPLWSSRQDIVAATHDAAMLVATDAGQRTLTLPRPMRRVSTGIVAQVHDLTHGNRGC